jgi:hypothetical protein
MHRNDAPDVYEVYDAYDAYDAYDVCDVYDALDIYIYAYVSFMIYNLSCIIHFHYGCTMYDILHFTLTYV